jgi:hypothetical protein
MVNPLSLVDLPSTADQLRQSPFRGRSQQACASLGATTSAASVSPAQRLKKLQLALSAPPQAAAVACARVYMGGGGLALAHDLSETVNALHDLTEVFGDKDAPKRRRMRALANARKVLGQDG